MTSLKKKSAVILFFY